MLNNPYLDTLISLILMFALLSILVSILTEWLNQRLNSRGKFLQEVIFKMMNDPANHNFGYLLYRHPIMERYRKDKTSLPQYMSADLFAQGLIETVGELSIEDKIVVNPIDGSQKLIEGVRDSDLFTRFELAVKKMSYSDTKRLFTHLIERSKTAGSKEQQRLQLQRELATWFNEHMDRATGWYKVKQRHKLLIFGFIVAIGLNVDTIHVTRVLLMDPALRAQTVALAEKTADIYAAQSDSIPDLKIQHAMDSLIAAFNTDSVAEDTTKQLAYWNKYKLYKKLSDSLTRSQIDRQMIVINKLADYGLPIGWQTEAPPLSWKQKVKKTLMGNDAIKAEPGAPTHQNISHYRVQNYFEHRAHLTIPNFLTWLVGILITAFALSFGAPFWFDLLVKFVNFRRSGVKPPPSSNNTGNAPNPVVVTPEK